MNVWAIANQKGGVGKTTTTITLGALAAAGGRRTLLVDLDPHASLTAYFRMDPDAPAPGVYDLFAAQAEGRELAGRDLIAATGVDRLGVLPASGALATLDRQLGARDGMGLVLARTLGKLAHDYEQVLIDCPPMLGVLMVNALAACDHLIIPVQTEFLALKGLERMLHTLAMIQRSRGDPVAHTIVATLFDRRTRAALDTLQALRTRHADRLWPDVIPVDTQFREASRAGRPLPDMRPRTRGVEAYRRLLDYLDGHAGTSARAEP